MDLFSNPKFGRAIKFENVPDSTATIEPAVGPKNRIGANAMVSQYLNIKNSYKKNLDELVGSDDHARRYFCGADCAFIFDVSFLEAMVATIKDKGPEGCMILFQGVRKDFIDPDNTDKGCAFGRPTLIATAYTFTEKELVHQTIPQKYLSKKLTLLGDGDPDGFEHPGDGSGEPSPFTSEKRPQEWRPKVVKKGNDDDDTDFTILRRIPLEKFEEWR